MMVVHVAMSFLIQSFSDAIEAVMFAESDMVVDLPPALAREELAAAVWFVLERGRPLVRVQTSARHRIGSDASSAPYQL